MNLEGFVLAQQKAKVVPNGGGRYHPSLRLLTFEFHKQ